MLDGSCDLECVGVDAVIGGNCDNFVRRDGYGGECIAYSELSFLGLIQRGLRDVGFLVLLDLAKQPRNCAKGKNVLWNAILIGRAARRRRRRHYEIGRAESLLRLGMRFVFVFAFPTLFARDRVQPCEELGERCLGFKKVSPQFGARHGANRPGSVPPNGKIER